MWVFFSTSATHTGAGLTQAAGQHVVVQGVGQTVGQDGAPQPPSVWTGLVMTGPLGIVVGSVVTMGAGTRVVRATAKLTQISPRSPAWIIWYRRMI